MKSNKFLSWQANLRIIWAITAKDILEALKNRHGISVVITALFIAIMYSYMPAITALDNPTNVLVYDAAASPLSAQLKSSQALEVYTYPSEEIMLNKLARGEVPELGLIIPADYAQSLSSQNNSQNESGLTGYVLYWVSDKEVDKMTQEVEAEITRLVGKPVHIRIAENRLIPGQNQHSLGNWVGTALVFLMIYISLALISNLMLEEKQTRTMEALMVSPASTWHMVIGKAVSGLFYCLLGIAVTMVINQKIVLHWWLLVPTLILGALFSISLGLIAGSMVEERGQLSIWTFGLLIPLFVPVILSILDDLFPKLTIQVLSLIPSVTFFQLLQSSFSRIPPASDLLKQFAWLAAWAIAGLAGAIWIIHRQQLISMGDHKSIRGKVGFALLPRLQSRKSSASSSMRDTTTIPSIEGIRTLSQSKFLARPVSWLRIVQTIAAKDVRQAIHNKIILSILLGTLLLVIGNALLLRGLSIYTGLQANLVGSSSSVLSIMICTSLMAIGVGLVPLLMLEEKETHTLETLLVSPARYIQVVTGKAIAGSVYCLSAVLVILIAYNFLIVHWELALLALVLGTAFVVALGLLIGMLSNNPTTIGMWAAVIMLALIIPTVIAGLSSPGRAPVVSAIMAYWPSTAIIKLFDLAMMNHTAHSSVIVNATIVVAATIVSYLATLWLIRRSDQ